MKIEKTYQLSFPVENVYQAWVSSETVIPPATAMDIDPVVGGHYRLHIQSPEFTAISEGKFLEVEPNKRVRYTWEWNNDGEVTEIAVTFKAIEQGTEQGTEIELIHSNFIKQESLDAHSTGWDSYIQGFTSLLEKK